MEEPYSVTEPSASTIFGEITDPEPTLLEPESIAVSHVEPSIAEPPPLVENARQDPVIYEIEPTNKGKRKLIDSNGYSYNVKRQRPNATDWQCIVRPKVNGLLCFIMISYAILRKLSF